LPDASVVIHEVQRAIFHSLERLCVIVNPPKKAGFVNTLVVHSTFRFEWTPIKLIRLEEVPNGVKVDMDQHRCEIPDPANNRLQSIFSKAQLLKA
jgi:hypothetical protein